MSPAQVAPNRAPPRFSEARGPPPLPVQGQGSFGAVTTVDPAREYAVVFSACASLSRATVATRDWLYLSECRGASELRGGVQ